LAEESQGCTKVSSARLHENPEQRRRLLCSTLQEVETSRYRMEEGDGTSHAQIIVKELYLRYQKQLQRWRDYRNLFFFLAFVALFLAVLYTQRQANTAYQVHATMQSVLMPSDTVSVWGLQCSAGLPDIHGSSGYLKMRSAFTACRLWVQRTMSTPG
jgi:hypothetical protein